jgi:hypothetical protein
VPRPRKSEPVVPTTALVASAHRYSGKVPRIYAPSKDWQKRAYYHYRVCGEARFAARYFGHAMSRAVLYLADAKGKRISDGGRSSLLDELFAGPDGQAGMMESVGVHLTVAGECYLVGREVDGADVWEVLSVMEIESGAAGWQMLGDDGMSWFPLSDDDVIIRVWIPQPDRRWEADSPFRSMLPILEEVERLTRYIGSQTTSRLAGNGLLFLSNNMTFPPPPEVDGQQQEFANEAESFMAMLGGMMMEALKGDGSAAEQVPGIVTADPEAIEAIKHITFWTPLDENAREMRKDAIYRFALGMDLPPEMVLGMGSNEGTGGGRSNGVSHWGAWMIEEQTIKMHIEPMLDLLCSALTTYYYRPLAVGSTDIIKADTSALRLRPDRSQESLELFDRGLVKGEVVVRENGFIPEDMLADEDRKMWLLMKVASGSSTPEQVEAALRALGVELDLRPVVSGPEIEEPRPAPEPPSLTEHPDRPRTPAENSSIGIYEALVLRALERAGNRLRNIHQIKTAGKAYEAHCHIAANGSSDKALEDAWGMADVVLAGRPDTTRVIRALDAYCRHLFEHAQPHTREALAVWCAEQGI